MIVLYQDVRWQAMYHLCQSHILVLSRWAFIVALIGYSIYKKSLTTWILISMIAGAEFGHDLPHIAVKMQVVIMIFLRLIKTIIAPLIFATLVVGIAGHSNLKQSMYLAIALQLQLLPDGRVNLIRRLLPAARFQTHIQYEFTTIISTSFITFKTNYAKWQIISL